MQNHPYVIEKRIAVFAAGLSCWGLFWQLSAYFRQTPLPDFVYDWIPLMYPVNLQFLNTRLLLHLNWDALMESNYAVFAFCIIGLLAAWLYIRSRCRATRLLQFFFSLVVLWQALNVFSGLLFMVKFFFGGEKPVFSVTSLLVAECAAIAWFSYRCLLALGRGKVPETALRRRIGRDPERIAVEASKTRRFVNHLVDTVCYLLVLSPMLFHFKDFAEKLTGFTGSERFALSVILIIFRFVYYPFFESVFGATPGKYLTGTCVVRADPGGRRPGFGTIMKRTLARHIPFEVFSFLAGGNWHDAASGTKVVRTVRAEND